MFLIKFLLWRGRPDPLYPFHTTPWCQVRTQGGLSHSGGCAVCTFARKGTPCASWLMGLVAQCGGIACNIFADVEDTEKHFHVPVTLSEAPSTSDSVTGTWKRLSASSTSATWALGSWGGGVVVIWCVQRRWGLPEYNRLDIKTWNKWVPDP